MLAGVEDLNNNYLPGVSKLVDSGKVITYFNKAPYMLSANTAWLEPNTTVAPLERQDVPQGARDVDRHLEDRA